MHDRVSFSQPPGSQLTEEQKYKKKVKRLNELSAETARLLDLPEDSFILGDTPQDEDEDPSEETAIAAAMAAHKTTKASAAAAMPLVHVPVYCGPVDASAPVVVAEMHTPLPR